MRLVYLASVALVIAAVPVFAGCPECQDEKCLFDKCICVERIGCRPAGEIIQQAGQDVGNTVTQVTGAVGEVAKEIGAKIEAIGGDGAEIVGGGPRASRTTTSSQATPSQRSHSNSTGHSTGQRSTLPTEHSSTIHTAFCLDPD